MEQPKAKAPPKEAPPKESQKPPEKKGANTTTEKPVKSEQVQKKAEADTEAFDIDTLLDSLDS